MRAADILPDEVNSGEINGVIIRKGTVAAFLANAREFCAAQTSDENRTIAEGHMLEALPALQALGIFDVFAVRDAMLRDFVEANTHTGSRQAR